MIANKESRDLVFCYSAFLPSLLGWIRLRPGVGVPTERLSGMPANTQKAPHPNRFDILSTNRHPYLPMQAAADAIHPRMSHTGSEISSN